MKIRRPAFTLLEMIIVLGIAALTMLIGWPSMQRTIQKNEERQFWQTFRQAWQAAQVRSKTSNESTHVFYLKSHSQVVFFWASGTEHINVPSTLSVRRFNDIEMKKNGLCQSTDRGVCFNLGQYGLSNQNSVGMGELSCTGNAKKGIGQSCWVRV